MRMIEIERSECVRKLEMTVSPDDLEDLLDLIEEQLSQPADSTWTSGFEHDEENWALHLRIIEATYYENPENNYYVGNRRIETLLEHDK